MNLYFEFETSDGIRLDISAKCEENKNGVILPTSPDESARYEVDIISIDAKTNNILPLLEDKKIMQTLHNECYKRCHDLFHG